MSSITTNEDVRAAVVALLDRARAHESAFTAGLSEDERAATGDPEAWSARALLVHITEFKNEQAIRLQAAATGSEPPQFAPVDHRDPETYNGFLERSWEEAEAEAERVVAALRALTSELDERLLFTPGALPWSRGRALWASVLVRGVWHSSGHLHQFLAEHRDSDRAVGLQQDLYTLAKQSGIPNRPGGLPFAAYNLACALALAGDEDACRDLLAEAVAADSNLARYATEERDLDSMRQKGWFTAQVA
jgi:uncharacterized damage-inducible protein DinB